MIRYRPAQPADIEQMQFIRNAVKENVLSDPSLVKTKDYHTILFKKGKGWVAEQEGILLGFAAVNLEEHNIWALFVHPHHEKRSVGNTLHRIMLDWYFSKTSEPVWLSTDQNTKAAKFYQKRGWNETGAYGKVEVRMEMNKASWIRCRMI